MTEYPDRDTLQQLAEHLAAKSGRTVGQEWVNALDILDVAYFHDVLALDEDGHVVNLGRAEDVQPPGP
jgi:hypothetical protein